MILGYGLLIFALAATTLANVLFMQSRLPENAKLLPWARIAATWAASGIVGAAAYLMYLIGTHHFEVAYVAEYSAKRSAPAYLYAAFWGGQEGSLLLWAFWTSILGAVLAFRAGDARVGRVWPIFGVVQVFLLGLILVKCPFALGAGIPPVDGKGLNPLLENPWVVVHPPILFLGFASTLIPWVWAMYALIYRDWDGWAKAAFPWALFSFAALGCGISLGGLWAYETLGWGGFWGWDPVECSSLVPWLFLTALLHGIPIERSNGGYRITNLLFAPLCFGTMCYGTFLTRTGLLSDFSVHSFSSLGKDGFCILLAGVYASVAVPLSLLTYRTLGPPVARLVRRTLGPRAASRVGQILAAVLVFGTIVISIFTARITADILVSIFAQPSGSQYNWVSIFWLIAALWFPIVPPLLLAAVHGTNAAFLGEIPRSTAYERVLTKEFGYFLGSAALGVLGLIVAVGMSAPLITKLWIAKGAAAQPEFYNTATYPLAILLTLGMAATPYVAWKGAGDVGRSLRRLFPAYVVSLVTTCGVTGLAYAAGVTRPAQIVLFASAIFAIAANVIMLVPRLPRRTTQITVGGFIAHIGAAMLLCGVCTLVVFSQRAERVILVKDVPNQALGYTLTYRGMTTQPYDRAGNAIKIDMARGASHWVALPRYYFAPWDNKDTLFANPPDIQRFFWGDLYIAYNGGPQGLDQAGEVNPNNGFTLAQNQSVQAGDYTFTFLGLDLDPRAKQTLSEHQDDPSAMEALPEIVFTAAVAVKYHGVESMVTPRMRLEQPSGGMYSLPVEIPGGTEQSPVMLNFIPPAPEEMDSPHAFDKIAFQTMNAPDPTEAVEVDVSTKPMIWMVWLGAALYTLGGLVAYRRRAEQASQSEAPASNR